MGEKSQSSFEYLTVFGIGFIFITILGGIFFTYSNSATKSLNKQQIKNFGNEIISNAERIYFLGIGNKITMKANFPSGIVNMRIIHKNVSDKTNPGKFIQFDYLDIETYGEHSKNINDTIHNIFQPSKEYIRINCTLTCKQSPVIKGEWNSTFISSDFSEGFKEIMIESKGDYVSIDFYKGN